MMMQSPHRDVLEATPDTTESKAKLVEELQSRGRSAVGAKSWMDAKLLYEKALKVVEEGDSKIAIFQSNLSLVHKNMGSMEEARQAALAATEADPGYVKGWWRLGQALQQLNKAQDALNALTKAKDLDSTNKALIKEHGKVQKLAEEEAKRLAEEAAAEPTPMEEDKPKTTTTTTTAAPAKKPATTTSATNAKASANKTTVDKGDRDLFTKSDAVRGYKVVNGKKTSYFHNELTEEAKKLIGDIAPKKLDPSSTPAPIPAQGAAKGASAWNKAGTWEEKDVTKWATKTLEEQLLQTTYALPDSSPAPGALVTISKVDKLEGHASFALARGKKRYIYEFLTKFQWQLAGNDGLECKGSLALPDIDGTIDMGEGYEIHEFCIDSVSDNSVKPLIERFVRRGGFSEALNESIDDWVRLFKKEY